jgi:A/G-specific adenine glycosylase
MATETSIKLEFERSLAPYTKDLLRTLPWRQLADDRELRFYQVLVSETMLQQTQVNRVVEKYNLWMSLMPDLASAATFSKGDYLKLWQGLGYYRRAGYLYDIVMNFNGSLIPNDLTTLSSQKGIGQNTASAISVYCDNRPSIFVETNIRSVIIHHFFNDVDIVNDNQIASVLTDLLPEENPRVWYWGMMDYGTVLKQQSMDASSKKSYHYRKQSTFKGSRRELRGKIVRLVTEQISIDRSELRAFLDDDRFDEVVSNLIAEDLLREEKRKLVLP